MPPPIVLLVTASAAVLVPTRVPGADRPRVGHRARDGRAGDHDRGGGVAGGVRDRGLTVWCVIVCPAFAGAARRSAAMEVPASNEEAARRKMRPRLFGSSGKFGIEKPLSSRAHERSALGLRFHALAPRDVKLRANYTQSFPNAPRASSLSGAKRGRGREYVSYAARPRALRARKERPRINGPALMSPSPSDEVAAGRVRGSWARITAYGEEGDRFQHIAPSGIGDDGDISGVTVTTRRPR